MEQGASGKGKGRGQSDGGDKRGGRRTQNDTTPSPAHTGAALFAAFRMQSLQWHNIAFNPQFHLLDEDVFGIYVATLNESSHFWCVV